MKKMYSICVVTGTRADYGLLSGLMRCIKTSGNFDLQVIASGMHLKQEYGLTYKEIENDGFFINEKVDLLQPGNDAVAISKSTGVGVQLFAGAFERLQPDLVVILGDRFEALSAAQAAMIQNMPIAHIHGGETTEGVIDESIRHAITKMSNIHFVSNEKYRRRVIQMGELPDRVITSGALGIDNIQRVPPITKQSLERELGFNFADVNFMITYHPITLGSKETMTLDNILKVVDDFKNANTIITYPNADAGGSMIADKLEQFAHDRKNRTLLVKSLGFKKYIQTLQYVDCVIGNSSSGIIEVPSLGIPTVNIGDRQKGRVRATSVIDCGISEHEIRAAIDKALSRKFKAKTTPHLNPYGNGGAATNIIKVLENISFKGLLRKPFYDLDWVDDNA